MADVVVDAENKSPKELLGQGIRACVLQDYSSAVAALSKASELLVAEHGDDLHESLGDVYLYYGKALLGLSREESEPLGDAVPKNKDDECVEDNGGYEEEDDEEYEDESEVKANGNGKIETVEQEKGAGEESSKPVDDGPSSSTNNEGGATADEEADKTAEDEPTDLQLAWEVLELAKKIYQKQGNEGRKNLAETLTVLGEISLESENFEAAINDIKEGLEIQKQLFAGDSRTVAETLYKLGMAYSTNSQIDEAIQCFNSSLEYLQNRVSQLQENDQSKPVILEEINEIKNLIPDIEEKIADMKSYKDETLKQIMSAVIAKKPSDCTPSSSSVSSSKPATDISHLVKRKRKLDEVVEDCEREAEGNPAKKVQ